MTKPIEVLERYCCTVCGAITLYTAQQAIGGCTKLVGCDFTCDGPLTKAVAQSAPNKPEAT